MRPDYTGTSRPWQGSQIQPSRETVVLDYLVLKTTLKKALSLESSNWSKMPSPISSSGKKGIQITLNTEERRIQIHLKGSSG